jgi:hypothetical protein
MLYIYLFIYLCIYGLLNKAVSTSDYIELNDRMLNE